jgi:hypothetical protein
MTNYIYPAPLGQWLWNVKNLSCDLHVGSVLGNITTSWGSDGLQGERHVTSFRTAISSLLLHCITNDCDDEYKRLIWTRLEK